MPLERVDASDERLVIERSLSKDILDRTSIHRGEKPLLWVSRRPSCRLMMAVRNSFFQRDPGLAASTHDVLLGATY